MIRKHFLSTAYHFSPKYLSKAILLSFVLTTLLLHVGSEFAHADLRFFGVGVTRAPHGVIITEVAEDSPATRVYNSSSNEFMSLQPGDIIQAVRGVIIENPEQFYAIVRTSDMFKIKFLRNGLFHEVMALLLSASDIAQMEANEKVADELRKRKIEDEKKQNSGLTESYRNQIRSLELNRINTSISILQQKINTDNKQNSGLTESYRNQIRSLEMEKFRVQLYR
jgi:hypothetical protein